EMDGYIIGSSIILIGIVGILGNLLFCYAIYKRPEIRSKHVIVCISGKTTEIAYDSLQFVNAICQMSHKQWKRSECFHYIVVYLFLSNFQAMMYVVIGADMLFALFQPFRYLGVRNFPYLLILQLPSIAFGIEHPLHGFIYQEVDDPVILACNPPLGTSQRTMQMWNISNIALSIIVLLMYVTVAVKVLCLARGKEESAAKARFTRGVVKSATVFSLFFSASWFLSKINDRFAVFFPNLSQNVIETLQTYSVIPAVASYAQTYYVHFLMSRDFRNAFKVC
ncbi:hypothetical protein PFISCL1PPCAC_25054, partial [Pristionchus fissidentatus]